jgi:hypothetical protein
MRPEANAYSKFIELRTICITTLRRKMSKKISATPSRSRYLTTVELIAKFSEGLETLLQLASIYDGGYTPIAFNMAVEINKTLTENDAATRVRGTRTFSSPDMGDTSKMLNAMHKLTMMQVGGEPPAVRFLPQFWAGPSQCLTLDFRHWWNRDVIYRASAAAPGLPPGVIPLISADQVSFDKREKITRRELISLLRNKIGAHQANELPALLEDMDHTSGFAVAVVRLPDGSELSTEDGTLPTNGGPLAAMVRQIAHELLVAYGRDDPPPQGDTYPTENSPNAP